jgi:hypothetical protein
VGNAYAVAAKAAPLAGDWVGGRIDAGDGVAHGGCLGLDVCAASNAAARIPKAPTDAVAACRKALLFITRK